MTFYDRLFGLDPTEVLSRLDDLRRKLNLVLQRQETSMALSDDLNNAVTSLASGYAAEHVAIMAELDALAKALAAVPTTDPVLSAAVTQAIANVTAISGTMATDAAALTAAVPAATAVPAPTVVAPVGPVTATVPDIATPPVTDPNATPPSTPPASATTTP